MRGLPFDGLFHVFDEGFHGFIVTGIGICGFRQTSIIFPDVDSEPSPTGGQVIIIDGLDLGIGKFGNDLCPYPEGVAAGIGIEGDWGPVLFQTELVMPGRGEDVESVSDLDLGNVVACVEYRVLFVRGNLLGKDRDRDGYDRFHGVLSANFVVAYGNHKD